MFLLSKLIYGIVNIISSDYSSIVDIVSSEIYYYKLRLARLFLNETLIEAIRYI